MRERGFYAEWAALRRETVAVDNERAALAEVRDTLRAAFDRDRLALGGDQYGAELAKKLPEIENGIFGGFTLCLDQLAGMSAALIKSADNYERAEHAGEGNA
jgi:hypothetical protein